MQPAGRYADFRAHAELSAIGELGRCVVHHDRGIDGIHELFRSRGVFGDDRIRVMRAVGIDVINCTFQPVDLTDGQYRFQIFGAPVFFGRFTYAVVERPCLVVSAKFAP